MPRNLMLAVAGLALVVAVNPASAAYSGLEVRLFSTVTIDGQPRSVYRVYAKFTDADDYLTAVAGSDLAGNMVIQQRNASDTAAGSGFYNNQFGGNTAPPPILFQFFPDLEWDTFATIGLAVNDNGADMTTLSPGFSSLLLSETGFSSNNAAWFVSNPVPQARAGAYPELRIMLAQFTVRSGEHVRGTVAISGVNAGAGWFQTNNQVFNSHDLLPQFSPQPASTTVDAGQSVSLAAVSGQSTTAYRWLRNGVPLIDGSSISGATTPTLTINPVSMTHAGRFSVVGTNTYGSASSNPATLTVICRGDVNQNLAVNVDDLLIVLAFWHTGPPSYAPADVNGDGYVNTDDLLALINHWGACP